MPQYVQHPVLTGTGSISVATPRGVRQIPMVDGVLTWPDDVPIHNTFRQLQDAPEALKAQAHAERLHRLTEEIGQLGDDALHALAQKLGLAKPAPKTAPEEAPKPAPKTAPKKAAQ